MAVLISAYEPSQAEGVVEFFRTARLADPVLPAVSLAQWKSFAGRESNACGRYFLLAQAYGQTVGVLTCSPRLVAEEAGFFARVIVSPGERRRGVGSALLDALVRTNRPRFVQVLCPSNWQAAEAFYVSRGFVELERELSLELQAYRAPDLSRMSALSVSTDRFFDFAQEVACLHDASYRSDPSFVPFKVPGAESQASTHRLIATQDGKLVGYCEVDRSGSSLWIENLLVAPASRNLGVGGVLLHRAISGLAQGSSVLLNVSSRNEAARHLYEKLGFGIRSHSTRFALGIQP